MAKLLTCGYMKPTNITKTLPSEFCCGLLELLLENTGGVMGACWGCVVNNRSGLLPRLVAPPVRRGDNSGLVGYQTSTTTSLRDTYILISKEIQIHTPYYNSHNSR